jgi:hypothetical protein
MTSLSDSRKRQRDVFPKFVQGTVVSVFEGGGSGVEGTASEAQVDVLYRQIGQLEGRKRFFGTKARQMSRAERRALVERENAALPVSQQCRLLAVSRSSVYRQATEVSEVDRAIMALIDRRYLARPYYGSRGWVVSPTTDGPIKFDELTGNALSEATAGSDRSNHCCRK